MSDAKYFICSLTIGSPVKAGENIQIALKEELPWVEDMPGHFPALQYNWVCPTYTVSELLCILPKRLSIKLQNEEVIEAELTQRWNLFNSKYITGYFFSEVPINCMKILRSKNSPFALQLYDSGFQMFSSCRAYDIEAESKCLIESLASLLIQCHKKDIGIPAKDTVT